jgi:hypothetical protein
MAAPEFRSLAAYSAYMTDRYQASDVSLQTYVDMLRRDPIVAFANGFVQRSVARRIGDYVDERDDVAQWVNRHVMPAVRRNLRCVQSAIYYGVSIAQPRYGVDEGEMVLAELVGCDPSRYWYGKFYRNDETGDVEAVDILGPGRVEFYGEAGQRQIVHHASGDAFGSPWGNPVARRVYTAYYIKRRLVGFEAIGLEKHGLATAVFKSNDSKRLEQYVSDWAGMGAENALGLDLGDEMTTVAPGWSTTSPFAPVIARLDGYIFNSFGIPHLTLAESQFGTRAQASVALEAYIMAETDYAERLADCVLEQIIEPAVALRFGRVKEEHALPVVAASEPSMDEVARIVQALSTAGAFDPAAEDQLRWLSQRMDGLPVDDLLGMNAAGLAGVPQ